MGRGARADLVLYVADVAAGHHRTHDPAFIIDLHDASISTELWLAFAALVICLGQFKVGRMLGRRYGDPPLPEASRSVRKHRAGRLDGTVVSEPRLLDRP